MAKMYLFKAGATLYISHKCDKDSYLNTATPPYKNDQLKYCIECNMLFLSEICFQNHVTIKLKGKLVCQWRQECRNCSYKVTAYSNHEYT